MASSNNYLLVLGQDQISQAAIDNAVATHGVGTVYIGIPAGATQPEVTAQFIQLAADETGESLAQKLELIDEDVVSAPADLPILALVKAHYEGKKAVTYIDALTEPTPASTDNSAASPTTEG